MNNHIIIIYALLVSLPLQAEMKIKGNGSFITLSDSIVADAKAKFDDESFPGDNSVVPMEIQKKIMILIGLNLALNEIECNTPRCFNVRLSQKSDDLKFRGAKIVKGYFNEIWEFSVCGEVHNFQVLGTAKGGKGEKFTVVQTNMVDPDTGERLNRPFSF